MVDTAVSNKYEIDKFEKNFLVIMNFGKDSDVILEPYIFLSYFSDIN